MDRNDPRSRVALALDVPGLDAAAPLIAQTREHIGVYKVGLELFAAAGPFAVDMVLETGAQCFLDLKMHDIPATMGRAVTKAAGLGVHYLTVHASAGRQALQVAHEAARSMRVLAVTVLTSFDPDSLEAIGFVDGPEPAAERLAALAWSAGIRGFVCSPRECKGVRGALGDDTFLVTPGIRALGNDPADQQRTATPKAAIEAGSDLLVVGRPIRDADDPRAAAGRIVDEVGAALR